MRSPLAAVLALAFVTSLLAIAPAEAQTPANCSAANLNLWWGYQYNQQVRSTWDGYSAASRGVCVMRDAQTPIPGDCRFSVEKPWWVPSGQPASPPLCWWGTPSTPAVTVSAPAGCFPTALSARAAYSNPNTRALWDYYSAQTVGVCESIGQVPGNCRFMVQEAATKHLCWWPAQGGAGLKMVFDRSAYEKLSSAALQVDEICGLVGQGTAVVEFRVDGERVQVQVKDCVLNDVQWITAPDGCRDIEPSTYAPIVGQAALDAGLANAADACLLPRAPTNGECTSSILVASSTYLCFYGKKTGATRAAVASFTGSAKFIIEGSRAAFRAILNAGDPQAMVSDLVCDGKIVMNAANVADKVKLRVATSDLLLDRVCVGNDLPPEPRNPLNHFGESRWTVMDAGKTGLYLDLGSGLDLGVANADGAMLGFLPGSVLKAEDDLLLGEPLPEDGLGDPDPLLGDPLPDDWPDMVLSQPPRDINYATVQQGLPVSGSFATGPSELGGLAAFSSLLSGQDPADILGWWFSSDDDRNPGLEWTGTVLQPITPLDRGEGFIGPKGPVPADDGPAETILDDITECKVICSATPTSGVFGAGAAYLGGGVAGLEARNGLIGAGLVGVA